MSMGTQSPLFRPVSEAMLETVRLYCTRLSAGFLRSMFNIMTDGLHTETLLFAALAVTIHRYYGGVRDQSPGFDRGAGIMLSAVKKDGSGKMQTPGMKLIHDVFVELPMAGSNFRKLQALLERHGITLVLMHSCGGAIVPAEEVDAFYHEVEKEQETRTLLDWQGSMEVGETKEVTETCHYSAQQAGMIEWVILMAEDMIKAEDASRLDPDPANEDETETEGIDARREVAAA